MGKYFKYAIGEIILVVIGILIALQINNWNEQKKQTSIEISYLKRLSQDLHQDSIFWLRKIEQRKQKVEGANQIMKFAFSDNRDTIFNMGQPLMNLITWIDTHINNHTFKEMLSSGNLNIIKNDSIKHKLLRLDQSYKVVLGWDNTIKEDYQNNLWPPTDIIDPYNQVPLDDGIQKAIGLNKTFTNDDKIQYTDLLKGEISSLFKNPKFRSGVYKARDNYLRQIEYLEEVQGFASNLKQLIDKEIENKE